MRDEVATAIYESDKKMKHISKINLQTSLPSEQNFVSKVFRKPKKAIKMFPIQSQVSFTDRNLIHQELKGRLIGLNSNCKNLKKAIKTENSYIPLSERAPQKIYDVYNDMRRNQMFAVCLPLTKRKKSNLKRQTLKMNLSDIQKIRSRTQAKKIAIPQSLFKGTLQSKISYSVGFKGQGMKPLEKAYSNKKQCSIADIGRSSAALKQRKRNHSQVNLQQMQLQFNKMLRKSTRNNICSPKVNEYRSKSRLKSVWNTIAVHKHNLSTDK